MQSQPNVQVLQARILQLEEELRGLQPTELKTFVGCAYGATNCSEPVDGIWVRADLAIETARNRAESEYRKWKAQNPNAVVVTEARSWSGREPLMRNDNHVSLIPALTIEIRYRK